ncbi:MULTISPECIES: HpcH/HpaI aldolase/citrate lyase family protein [unclassified Chelatococcus]|uniref:HpcH/HpaI aldolase family protein n=1 Tax=unclassified Chelatococcus TaxID=2638111 RepID=UPI001BCD03A7|nr:MULTISPECIES: HpcH/HpaI aldolase/citrate lyase family protein [unclassified Chelatococcus]MBS7698697.1 HpcH/HpaI aldolase/citrate lyase family protein [Chelatococcus sp. YT9]MBX3554721.1 HpcH/HpaI aldolase/citrate lyase family protein [Chelatococcus sp.]
MRTDLPANSFKSRLQAGNPLIGFWLTTASPTSTEIAAGAGFDWLLIDMEHSPNELPDIGHHLRAAEGGVAEPIVRVPWNEPVLVKRLLDLGARTLLFPYVQSAEEARQAVAATRYPPHGIRGLSGLSRANRYGRVPDYFGRAADEICVLVQVETRRGLDAIEDIAAIDGVDGLFIGPADLSADFGKAGKWREPEIWSAIIEGGRRIKAAGKAAGFLSASEADCRDVIAAGFTFVAVGIDAGILARQTDALVKTYKG